MAIALALELGKIQAGDEVLIPAYQCSSMVSPVVHAGASPVFYKIQPDMTVDMEQIQEKLTRNTKALLATHYFGFAQRLPELRAFSDAHNLVLIEDCAHSFFGEVEGQPIGSYGDYAIGSLMKFFPVFDGGCLVSRRYDLAGQALVSGGKGFELQSLLNVLEKSFQFNRLTILKWLLFIPLSLKSQLWNWIKRDRQNRGISTQSAPVASGGGFDFDPEWIHTRSSYSTKMLIKTLSKAYIVSKRRKNFTFLVNSLQGFSTFRPLIRSLNETTVPYVFPLLVDNPDPGFYKLRSKGVPLMRWEVVWEGVNANTCQISHHYSRHLVQIPCHQSLTQKELEWMVQQIKQEFCASAIV